LANIQAANVARAHDPQLADFYRRLMVERGHCHTKANCAVARKLVAGAASELGQLGSAHQTQRRTIGVASPIAGAPAVAGDLPRHGRWCSAQPPGDAPQRLASRQATRISSRSANDRQSADRVGSGAGGRSSRRTAR
jgi:hypothetical protein